jgi:hypothetical protein
LEETAEGERCIAIVDATTKALRAMAAAAAIMTLFFAAVRWLARRLRRTGA